MAKQPKHTILSPRKRVAVNLIRSMDALLAFDQMPSEDYLAEAIKRARAAQEIIGALVVESVSEALKDDEVQRRGGLDKTKGV